MKSGKWNNTEEQGSSLWKDAFLRLSRNRASMFSLLALALNFLGDGLRDALDPKSSRD